MSGIIENPEFEKLVKGAFTRILFLKLKHLYNHRPQQKLLHIYTSDLTKEERQAAERFKERDWLAFIKFDHQGIKF